MLTTLLAREADFGLAVLDDQSPHNRAHAPLPSPDGDLVQDPEITLPTTAGPLSWRLFYYSYRKLDGEWGYGRRASFPLRLCSHASGGITTVMLEREDGTNVLYVDSGEGLNPITPRIFDTLVHNGDGSWDEIRFDTGNRFHYPVGEHVSLAYYQTPHGYRVTCHYNSLQLMEALEEPAGRRITYSYNGENRVESVADWAGRSHQFVYDARGDMVEWEDPTGAFSLYDYDRRHRLVRITDPEGFDTSYTYDQQRRVLTRHVSGDRGRYSYTWDGEYTRTEHTDAEGHHWVTWVDAQGNIVRDKDPVGAQREAEFTPRGLPTSYKDARDNETTFEYNEDGRRTLRVDALGGEESWEYDEYGNLLTYQNALENAWTYAWDGEKRELQSETNPLGETTNYLYTAWGTLRAVETPLGYRTTYKWDAFGNRYEMEDPAGYRTTWTHDAAGNVATEMDPLGRVTTYTYDAANRLLATENMIGARRSTLYDLAGQVSAEIDPLGYRTSYYYDARGGEVRRVDAKGYAWTTVYNKVGRPIRHIDPMGNATENAYDGAGRHIRETDEMGVAVTTVYDSARNPIEIQHAAGQRYITHYDAANRPFEEELPGGLTTKTVYDPAGRIIATTDTAELRTTSVFDAAGRPWAVVEPNGGRTTTIYDADGRPTGSIDALGHRTTTVFDARGLPVLTIDPYGRRWTTTYDACGIRKQDYSPDNRAVQYEYDAAGRNHAVVDYLGWRMTTTFDLADRVVDTSDIWGNRTTDLLDELGLITATIDPYSRTYETAWRPDRSRWVTVDSDGNRTTFSYNARGSLTLILDALANSRAFHYDAYGRYVATEDPFGNFVLVGYDEEGRQKTVESPVAGVTEFDYQVNTGRLASITNPLDDEFTYHYDESGQQVGLTLPGGFRSTTVFDLIYRPVAQVDELGYRTTTSYDFSGRWETRQDALGYLWTTLYDERRNPLAQIDPLGHRTSHAYDEYSRLIATQDALGYTSGTLYDGYGRHWADVNARGYRTTTYYDNFSRVAGVENARGEITTTLYDAYGRYAGTEDPLGHSTGVNYDLLWRVWSTEDELGYRTTTAYDLAGRVWSTEDPLGRRTSTIYDAAGRVTGRMNAAGEVTYWAYDLAGNQIAMQNPLGFVTSYLYDGRQLQTTRVDALGYRWSTIYDARGQAEATVDPLGFRRTTVYDALMQGQAQLDARGYRSTTLFDPARRAEARIDALGRRTTSIFDAVAQEIGRIWPDGVRASTLYDPNGNPIAVMNGLGHVWSSVYDPLDRVELTTDPLGRRHTSVYDAGGRLSRVTDPKGQITTYTYSDRNELTGRAYTDSTSDAFVYDPAGQRTGASGAVGAWSYTYDRAGRLRTEHGPGFPFGHPFTSSYDLAGNRTVLQTGRGAFSYSYDPLNRMTGVTDPGYGATPSGRTTWSYDARGLATSRVNANGTTTTASYDPDGRALYLRHAYPNGSEIDRAAYTYDAVGNPLTMATVEGTHAYGYDSLNQLTSENHLLDGLTEWTYDAARRRKTQTADGTTTTYSYDAADELLAANASGSFTTYSYDRNGNRTVLESPGGSRTTYTWDAADRLLEVLLGSGNRLTNTYRPDGMRHARNDGSGEQTLVWDGDEVLYAEGDEAQAFVHGPTLARAIGSSMDRAYHQDHTGTIQALTDEAGALLTRYRTDVWGNVTSGSASGNPYVYGGGLGYWYEPEASLNYVRARWLDPATGSWLSIDPVTSEAHYTYAGNRATTHVDASGLQGTLLPDLSGLPAPIAAVMTVAGKVVWAQVSDWIGDVRQLLSASYHSLLSGLEGAYKGLAFAGYKFWRDHRRDAAGTAFAFVVNALMGTPLDFNLAKAANAAGSLAGRESLGQLGALLPPDPMQPEYLLYMAGFKWEMAWFVLKLYTLYRVLGAAGKVASSKLGNLLSGKPTIQSLFTFLNPVSKFCMDAVGIMQVFNAIGHLLKQPIDKATKSLKPEDWYNRGKRAGIIFVTLISAFIGLGGTNGAFAKNLPKGPKLSSTESALAPSTLGIPQFGTLRLGPSANPAGVIGGTIALPVTIPRVIAREGITAREWEALRQVIATAMSALTGNTGDSGSGGSGDGGEGGDVLPDDEFNSLARQWMKEFADQHQKGQFGPSLRWAAKRTKQLKGTARQKQQLLGWFCDTLRDIDAFWWNEGFTRNGATVYIGSPDSMVVTSEGKIFFIKTFRDLKEVGNGIYEVNYDHATEF